MMNEQQFVEKTKPRLTSVLNNYLAGKILHEDVQKFIDGVFVDWEHNVERTPQPMLGEEKVLWCSVWAAQHLATKDHWVDGVAQREIGLLLKVLKGEEPLPEGYESRRP